MAAVKGCATENLLPAIGSDFSDADPQIEKADLS